MDDWGSDQYGGLQQDGSERAQGANLAPRFFARLIDGIFLGGISFLVIFPLFDVSLIPDPAITDAEAAALGTTALYLGLLTTVLTLAYFALMESARGQTLGKMVLRLKTQGPDGKNPPLGMAIKRNVWYLLSVVPVVGPFALFGAYISIAVTISTSETNAGWHDKFAGNTRVVKI